MGSIDHKALLSKISTYPTLNLQIKTWLKAGYCDQGSLFPTNDGTPQGGVISPLLANKVGNYRAASSGLYFTSTDIVEVDHKLPLSLGGKDQYDNLQLLHRHCHDTKTAADGSLHLKESAKTR